MNVVIAVSALVAFLILGLASFASGVDALKSRH